MHQHQEVISYSQYLQLQGRGHFYKNSVSPGSRTIKNDREHGLYYGNLTLKIGSWLMLDVVLYCFCICGWDWDLQESYKGRAVGHVYLVRESCKWGIIHVGSKDLRAALNIQVQKGYDFCFTFIYSSTSRFSHRFLKAVLSRRFYNV